MSTTTFQTASGTVYCYNHSTRVLSSSRSEEYLSDSGNVYRRCRVVIELVDATSATIVEGDRAEIRGSHPTDGRSWCVSTSPVRWLSTFGAEQNAA